MGKYNCETKLSYYSNLADNMKEERTIIREKEKREHPLFMRFYKNIEGEGPNFQEYVKKKPITETK